MNTLVVEFEDGRRLPIQSEVSYQEAIKRINTAQILLDSNGLPIDLTSIKRILSED